MTKEEIVKVGNLVTEMRYDEFTKLWYVDMEPEVYSGASIDELAEKVKASGKSFTRYSLQKENRIIESDFDASELDGKKVQFFLTGKDIWLQPEEAGKRPMLSLSGIGVFSTILDAGGFYLDIEVDEEPRSIKQIMLAKQGGARIERHPQKDIAEFLIAAADPS